MGVIAGAVALLHVLGWGGVWVLAGPEQPTLLGLASLAYAFGLRHAFDADHIAAIDNTTRRLMLGGTRPLGVGLYFSLGHSTIVFAMTAAIVVATQVMTTKLPGLHAAGQAIGTTISGVFLYAIGLLNLFVLIDVFRVFRQMRRGEIDPAAVESRLLTGGVVTRWCGGLFRLVERPWQMYLVGGLFGLGFDTATEIGLLTTAAIATSQAVPATAVLCLPIVFAAGMSLMDAADGILMCRAYGWAFEHAWRKVFYNLVVTGLSVAVALVIGTIELVSVATDWSISLDMVGYGIVAAFLTSWGISVTAKSFASN